MGPALIIGPALGGVLYDQAGPHAPFIASAVLLTLGTLVAILALRNQLPKAR